MIINDYKLIEQIGKGSYGEVWRGINSHKNNNVAIKISKKSIKNILKMEIIILRHLKHLKVVPNQCIFYYPHQRGKVLRRGQSRWVFHPPS